MYFVYGIWHSKENQRELPGLTATHGSLEETAQALQQWPGAALITFLFRQEKSQ